MCGAILPYVCGLMSKLHYVRCNNFNSMALHSLYCADVPTSAVKKLLTHSLRYNKSTTDGRVCALFLWAQPYVIVGSWPDILWECNIISKSCLNLDEMLSKMLRLNVVFQNV